MMAVLKAIAEARKTGLTEQQIIDRIERTKPVEFWSGSKALVGDNAGWNPLTEDLKKLNTSRAIFWPVNFPPPDWSLVASEV